MSHPQALGPRLELHCPGLPEQVYELKGADLQIGRAPGLEVCLEVNGALGGGADLDEILVRALDGLMTIFPAVERGFILILEPQGRPRVRAVRHRRGPAQPPVPRRTILEHVVQQAKAVLVRDRLEGCSRERILVTRTQRVVAALSRSSSKPRDSLHR
jgi:hypothetical protein